jgi:hypothetical protein
MSDPFAPPPRRSAPEPLREEIARRLSRATAPRRRVRIVLIPLAAAVMVATVVVGVVVLGGRPSMQPVQTASPYPTTASPTQPRRPASTPTPSVATASMGLDVRPMSKTEIAADTRSCRRRNTPDDGIPRRGAVRVLYATVQIQAGVSGPVRRQARALVLQDEEGTWFCENGTNPSWTAGILLPPGGRGGTHVVSNGGFRTNCGNSPKVSTEVLFSVGDEVALGRTRINMGSIKGPWQTSRPDRGMINFRLVLEGESTRAKSVFMEFEILDRRGDRVTIHRDEKQGGPDTWKTAKLDFSNCLDVDEFAAGREPIRRPVNDEAGIRTCRDLVKESATERNVSFGNKWKPRLVISTEQRWGAVLSDGANLVGCSLFPTKEISPFSPDSGTVAKRSFFFAVNPIDGTPGASLWAAGKVPTDVSAISYRLPGGRDVAATINRNGYWMLMYHSDTADIGPESNATDWEPVVVTVTRVRGTETFSISFTEETMCRQVSHGC